MPQELITIPPLQLAAENSSEAEISSTAPEVSDRSLSTSQNSDRQLVLKKKPTICNQNKNKPRKSVSGKRMQKKMPLKVSSQQKCSAAFKLKSNIPRSLLLTPSTSSASLNTNDSLPSPLLPLEVRKHLTTQKNALSSTLQRQKTGIIIAYRQRKSISQMDLKQARRNMPYQNDRALRTSRNFDKNTQMVSGSQNSFVQRTYEEDNFYYALHERPDPQMAGMKIFYIIMLNAWRKRRDEVKRLMEEVADLKRGAVKAKNQLHVFNTLFRVEQKRNDELNCQLKRSFEDINVTKSSCECLTTSLMSLKADKALLEQQLQTKNQEFDTLNTIFAQTKTDLFKHMSEQRELQRNLSMEQRKVQNLENQKNDLINEICELNNDAMEKEECSQVRIQLKLEEIAKAQDECKVLEEQIQKLKESKEEQRLENEAKVERLEQENDMIQLELEMLHKCLELTFGNRVKHFWHNVVIYRKVTFEIIHLMVYYLLPATPPPKITPLPHFGVSLEKVLRIVKRQ